MNKSENKISRREFLSQTGAAMTGMVMVNSGLALYSNTPGKISRFVQSAQRKQAITENIVWFNHEPLVFYLRRGHMMENWPETYEQQHHPENIRLMNDAGVTYGRLHFYKGLGLKMEMEEIKRSQKVAQIMHKYGMKVSLYVAGTMFIEPFYREVPEAKYWEQRDQNGRAVPYSGTQTFRHYACPHEPAYRDYMKKVIKIGIESVHADQLFFDNIQLQPEPKSCRDDRCLQAFKEFLRKRYPTKEKAFRRFGYPDVDYIQVNEWYEYNQPSSLTAVDDPVLQEWIRFRCVSLANHCADLAKYAKSLNPNVSVGFNLKGLYGATRAWSKAIYHPLYSGISDFSPFDVGGMDARIDSKTGALVSEIRSYKLGRILNIGYTGGGGSDLEMAVHMAFNHQKHTPGYGYEGGPPTRTFTPLAEFFRTYNTRYYVETENVADVAVLRTWPSMAYSIGPTLVPTILMEQVLIQHKIPFDIIFDEQIGKINNYQMIILPGQESLSQENIDRLIAYAKNGGTVLFTDNTATYNKWREQRPQNPLLELLGTSVDEEKTDSMVKSIGKGRIVYIPKIIPGLPLKGKVQSFRSSNWKLPKNHESISEAIERNLSEGLSITTDAPLTTVMEFLNRDKSKESIVHFINFEHQSPLKSVNVRMKTQFNSKIKNVLYFSKEYDEPRQLKFRKTGDKMIFTTPKVQMYGMVVVSYT